MKISKILSFFSMLSIITITSSLVSCSTITDSELLDSVTISDGFDSSKNIESNIDYSTDFDNLFEGYTLIEVDGGDLSGDREPNVVVDIGFGDREYYAYTNKFGQLIKVVAKEIILQDDDTEPVNSSGRYYHDEAKVPGVESPTLDEGHVIADSLGGVANAYNITPQDSTVNRHGEQADIEDAIRDANGCTDFVAIITYPDINTQTPSLYNITYTIDGEVFEHSFYNGESEEYNVSKDDDEASNNSSDINEAAINEIVYWTEGGTKYHNDDDCSTLSRSSNILDGLLSESGKFDPCNICY